MRKTYKLRTWRGWDRHVDTCVRDFSVEFGTAPNLLVANRATLRRLGVAANHARAGHGAGPGLYVELSGLGAQGYELWFVEEAEVPENSFALIYAFADDELDQAAIL